MDWRYACRINPAKQGYAQRQALGEDWINVDLVSRSHRGNRICEIVREL